eukprot:GHRR01025569.1.p1 GENE.GHRR01025569.1~~GHRR01025569.1.p1  ORF type:complete len:178 (+),score=15.73 GHRR01025569.1:939-1472(+)
MLHQHADNTLLMILGMQMQDPCQCRLRLRHTLMLLTITLYKVAPLNHEIFDHSVKLAPFIALGQSIFPAKPTTDMDTKIPTAGCQSTTKQAQSARYRPAVAKQVHDAVPEPAMSSVVQLTMQDEQRLSMPVGAVGHRCRTQLLQLVATCAAWCVCSQCYIDTGLLGRLVKTRHNRHS